MSSFADDPTFYQGLDWQLLRHGPVSMYFDRAQLDIDLDWLSTRFDCGSWRLASTSARRSSSPTTAPGT